MPVMSPSFTFSCSIRVLVNYHPPDRLSLSLSLSAIFVIPNRHTHTHKKSHGVVSCSILFLFHLLFEMLNDIQGNKKRRKDLSFFFFLLFQQSVCPTEEEEEESRRRDWPAPPPPHATHGGDPCSNICRALSFVFLPFLLEKIYKGVPLVYVPGRPRVSGVRLGVCISCPSLARSYYSVTVSFLPPENE